MRLISVMSVTVCSFFLVGCGDTPTTDNSANQPNIALTVTINEESIVVEPNTVGNGKLVLDISNKTADTRQIRIDGLGVNVLSLPIAAKEGKQQLVLNMFTQKGKLIVASTTPNQEKRLEANITVK
ncbi:MAG: hypothetical protein A2V81_01000 [Candidatus Abawacabacteria bacterium RBG_16_42_10]|uniref:Uncharacterized protein n=1 Tax=Candidatus Abawacabacteria bacterium RBG_16_42_10 TaxID=1817814 RepID=A0A1F4XLI9_9BACT|nr:MAG: hypothetical protein A2V81_01000 [Candidatus Abawacabacteria bacterium RBG_16_42_10]